MAHPLFSGIWFGKSTRSESSSPALDVPVHSLSARQPVGDDQPGQVVERKKEKRSFVLSDPFFWQHFNMGRENLAKVDVTQTTSLGVPPFFCAVRYIAEGVAMLDREVRRKKGQGSEIADGHPMHEFFGAIPYPYYTWFDFTCALLVNACLGNGYARIHWDYSTMRPLYFEHIPSMYCRPDFDGLGNLWYWITGVVNGKTVIERVPYTDMIHIKGLSLDAVKGLDITFVHESTLASGIARQDYTQSVLGKGARPSIAIKVAEALDENEVDAMEERVMDRIGGASNAGRPLVLDNGSDVRYLQWSPLEAALEALANLNVEDTCRLTKVPRDLMALDSKGTYGGRVQGSHDFLTHCLSPWIEKIQEEFNYKGFYVSEFRSKSTYFTYNTNLYVAMSKKEETDMLQTQVRGLIRTPNEARAVLGLEPTEHGDTLYGDINFLPIGKLVEIATAKYLSAEGEKLHVSEGAVGKVINDTEDEPGKSKQSDGAAE